MTPASTLIRGVVLCGGGGRRMGGADKPLLELDGRALVAHVIERVTPQVSELVLSVNRNFELYRRFDLPVVADSTPDVGPLAGISAAGRAFLSPASDCLFVCPGDSPMVPRDLVARLYAALVPGIEVVVPNDGERIQPLFMLVRCETVTSVDDYLRRGGRSVHGWLEDKRIREVVVTDPHGFANVNSQADLDRLG